MPPWVPPVVFKTLSVTSRKCLLKYPRSTLTESLTLSRSCPALKFPNCWASYCTTAHFNWWRFTLMQKLWGWKEGNGSEFLKARQFFSMNFSRIIISHTSPPWAIPCITFFGKRVQMFQRHLILLKSRRQMHAIVLQTLVHSSVKCGGCRIWKHCLKAISSDFWSRGMQYIPEISHMPWCDPRCLAELTEVGSWYEWSAEGSETKDGVALPKGAPYRQLRQCKL